MHPFPAEDKTIEEVIHSINEMAAREKYIERRRKRAKQLLIFSGLVTAVMFIGLAVALYMSYCR